MGQTITGTLAFALAGRSSLPAAESNARIRLCLSPGSIGVSGGQRETIARARQHRFDAVEPFADFLTRLDAPQLETLLGEMKAAGLVWGAAGFPVNFRQDDAAFAKGMEDLPRVAAGLQRAGVTRVGTWLSPSHNSLTYLQNFKLHQKRLREAALVLKEHGLRLGLEYVGTPSARRRARHSFIHSLAEARELIGEIGAGNVGVVLDSWHWWTAGETDADLAVLKAEDVISVDLNDAPQGIPLEQQLDNQRELPAATGVIPVASFLKALQRLGYDGPLRAEPFNKKLNDLPDDEACAATIQALRKAMALVQG